MNISANHLVCDLTPFDSMAQPFGRVNRFGKGNARIDIVHHKFDGEPETELTPSADQESETTTDDLDESSQNGKPSKKNKSSPYDKACKLTLDLMQKLPKRPDGRYDASPSALADLPVADRRVAFTPTPTVPPVSDILFDAWAMTSIRGHLPGRPPVADWLHGTADWEPADTHIAWREEVEFLTEDLAQTFAPEDLLEDYPLKPHELLRDRTTRGFSHLEKIAARHPKQFVWVIDQKGTVNIVPFDKVVKKDQQRKPVIDLGDCTLLLPPMTGGLKNGLLDGEGPFDESDNTYRRISCGLKSGLDRLPERSRLVCGCWA